MSLFIQWFLYYKPASCLLRWFIKQVLIEISRKQIIKKNEEGSEMLDGKTTTQSRHNKNKKAIKTFCTLSLITSTLEASGAWLN